MFAFVWFKLNKSELPDIKTNKSIISLLKKIKVWSTVDVDDNTDFQQVQDICNNSVFYDWEGRLWEEPRIYVTIQLYLGKFNTKEFFESGLSE